MKEHLPQELPRDIFLVPSIYEYIAFFSFSRHFIQELHNVQGKECPDLSQPSPFIPSSPLPLTPVHVGTVHWLRTTFVHHPILRRGASAQCSSRYVAILRDMRKSGASHKTWQQSWTPSWSNRPPPFLTLLRHSRFLS